ncbi:hypothetical protein PUN28_020026 [Cardiocondyla obscurior]|uniref:Uncharacterized protein n=1 Tax=Cardiocondyla obscurior TaxID=286306 RepID=A0AAW2EA94_9HYME
MIRCFKTPIVGNVLSCILQLIDLNSDTFRLSAIYISSLCLIMIILFHKAFGSSFKSFYRSVVPPMMQISMQVILSTCSIFSRFLRKLYLFTRKVFWKYSIKILMQTNHWFTLAVKNLSDEHRADGKTHGVINIVDAITPLLFVTFHAEQSFPQAFVSFTKRFREECR